jgi:hypothetical protein
LFSYDLFQKNKISHEKRKLLKNDISRPGVVVMEVVFVEVLNADDDAGVVGCGGSGSGVGSGGVAMAVAHMISLLALVFSLFLHDIGSN